jgi:hypothetical protein
VWISCGVHLKKIQGLLQRRKIKKSNLTANRVDFLWRASEENSKPVEEKEDQKKQSDGKSCGFLVSCNVQLKKNQGGSTWC